MRVIDEHTITEAAVEQMAGTPSPRLKFIMETLVKHLHEFAREVDLSPEEWIQGIGFLTAVGQKCTEFRQEFILLSDTLGLSALVNALHDRQAADVGTKSSLVGPFFRQDAPPFKLGDSIATLTKGGPEIGIYGRITGTDGRPIPNATIQIWQTDHEGEYDLQKRDPSEMDMRGIYHADTDGKYWLRTLLPLGYLIPLDGPVGDMIRAQKRHGFRPAHIHFMIGAPGYRELVTALYLQNDDHIDSDTVFGVSESLVTNVAKHDPASPFPGVPSIHYDFALGAAAADGSGRVGADPSQFVKASH